MTATPASRASRGDMPRSDQTLPSTEIVPAEGGVAPARHLIRVLLPAPLAPSRACTSPALNSMSTPERTGVDPYVFSSPLTPNAGMRSAGAVAVEDGTGPNIPSLPL